MLVWRSPIFWTLCYAYLYCKYYNNNDYGITRVSRQALYSQGDTGATQHLHLSRSSFPFKYEAFPVDVIHWPPRVSVWPATSVGLVNWNLFCGRCRKINPKFLFPFQEITSAVTKTPLMCVWCHSLNWKSCFNHFLIYSLVPRLSHHACRVILCGLLEKLRGSKVTQ